jgi:hypothetical protein
MALGSSSVCKEFKMFPSAKSSWKSLSVIFTKLVVTSMFLVGCSLRGCSGGAEDIPPEDQLHSYIKAAVNVTKIEHKQELVDLTTGSLKAALINASEETFKKAYIDKKYDFKNFEIIQRKDKEPGKETDIDFKLTYRSWAAGEAGDRAPVVSTTNRATLQYDHGQWALAKIESLSSNFEWDVGLPLDDVSTKGITPESEPVSVESSRQQGEEAQKEQEKEQKALEQEGNKP